MTEIDRLLHANRLEVFRYSFRNLALASAAASGLSVAALSGCAHSSAPTNPAPTPATVAASHPGPPSQSQPGDVWTPSCGPRRDISLSGLVLADGSENFLIGSVGSIVWMGVHYTAGGFCEDEDEATACRWRQHLVRGEDHTVFTMEGGVMSARPLSALAPSRVTTPQEAVIAVLLAGYVHLCGTEGFDAGPGSITTTETGFRVVAYRMSDCASLSEATLDVNALGDVSVVGERVVQTLDCPVAGRLTEGVSTPVRPALGRAAGRYFAHVAGVESAAVYAFERMARELREHDAPEALVEWAAQSAVDEREHTRAMTSLARDFGVEPRLSEAPTLPLRSLFDVVLENAVEGCVRETYGAVVGHYQAHQAQDPAVRATMSRVADDETRHAALSWELADWALPLLSSTERAQVAQAQRDAIRALELDAQRAESPELLRLAGLPDPVAARHLLDGLLASVWA